MADMDPMWVNLVRDFGHSGMPETPHRRVEADAGHSEIGLN